jgi:tetratricopeptide (TPR) repeat protein
MRFLAAVFALSVLTPVSVSLAQGKNSGASEADTKRAKQLFEEAKKHFLLREYKETIPLLKEAYRLYPAPLFLYNLAQCHLELKEYEEAISYFENFIDSDPKSKERPQAEKFLKQAKEAYTIEQEKKQRDEEAKREQERLQKMLELEKQKQAQGNTTDKREGPTFYKKWWFWTAVGGAAVAGTGTAVGVSIAKSIPNTDLGNQDILDK